MASQTLRSVKIHPDHAYVVAKTSNTANVRSGGLVIEAPNNVFLVLDQFFGPVIKLFTSAPAALSASTRVFVGKKRKGDDTPTFLPGVFTLHDFSDLTTAQQRDRDNQDTLVQDLGRGMVLREGEQMIVEFDGPDVIDWTQAGTAFEFNLGWSAV